jgi:uncharacterized membrane protein
MSEASPPESGKLSDTEDSSAPAPKENLKTLEELIKEKAPEVLKAIPVSEGPKLASVTIAETRISYRSGMLPEPSELSVYNQIILNGAERIMKMVEAQSAHRLNLEKNVVGSQQTQEKRGQIFGLIIGLVFGSFGLSAALLGQPWFGGIIAGAPLVSIVGILLFQNINQKGKFQIKRK